MDSSRDGQSASRNELMPRSERARFIDLVKLRGVVDGSRRSMFGSDLVIVGHGIVVRHTTLHASYRWRSITINV